jgi:hypothetical protein
MIHRHTDLVNSALQVGGDARDNADRWADELATHGVNITSDDYWPVLTTRLSRADAAGINVPAILRTATTTDQPLPAEGAAGALWWHLAPHIGASPPSPITATCSARCGPTKLNAALGEARRAFLQSPSQTLLLRFGGIGGVPAGE